MTALTFTAQPVQKLTGPIRKFKIPYWPIKHEPDPRGRQMQKITGGAGF